MCSHDPTHPPRQTHLCAATPWPNPSVLRRQAVQPHAEAERNSPTVRFTPMPLPGSLPLLLLVQTGLQLRPASLARPPPHLEEFALSLNSRDSFCRLSLGARVRPEPSSTITTDARSRKWGFCMRAGAPSVTVIALGRGKRQSAEAEESSLSSYRASVSRQPPTGWHALAQGDA